MMGSPVVEAPARRRMHWGWTLGLTCLLLAGATAVALHSPWLQLHHLEVLGAERAEVSERLASAGIGPGAYMIWLGPGEIEAVVRRDPWVLDVRVERLFPDRVVVEVLEHTPAVWAGGRQGWVLVSQTGAVLVAADAPGEGMLRARVPWEQAAVGRALAGAEWKELAGLGLALSPALAGEAWVTSEGGELWIEAGGHRARLGPAVDLADKGRAFEGLLVAGLPEGALIDLVAPTRPAVSVPGAPDSGEGEGEGEPVVEGEDGG